MNNQQIDKLIAKKIMGYYADSEAWSPSTNIADAWRVIERLIEMGFYPIIWPKPCVVQICDFYEVYLADEKAPTIPLAICLAALKAVGIELE